MKLWSCCCIFRFSGMLTFSKDGGLRLCVVVCIQMVGVQVSLKCSPLFSLTLTSGFTVEAIWIQWHVYETSLRWSELCDMVLQPLEDGYSMIVNEWTWSATMLRQAVAFKKCWVGIKRTQSVPRKCYIPHIITTPPAAFQLLIWRRMFNVVHAKFESWNPKRCNSNQDSSDQATLSQFQRIAAHWIFSRLWTVLYKL